LTLIEQLAQKSALGEVLASGLRALSADPRCSEDDLRTTMQASGA
jgi:biopolymer transport protein ExbB